MGLPKFNSDSMSNTFLWKESASALKLWSEAHVHCFLWVRRGDIKDAGASICEAITSFYRKSANLKTHSSQESQQRRNVFLLLLPLFFSVEFQWIGLGNWLFFFSEKVRIFMGKKLPFFFSSSLLPSNFTGGKEADFFFLLWICQLKRKVDALYFLLFNLYNLLLCLSLSFFFLLFKIVLNSYKFSLYNWLVCIISFSILDSVKDNFSAISLCIIDYFNWIKN